MCIPLEKGIQQWRQAEGKQEERKTAGIYQDTLYG